MNIGSTVRHCQVASATLIATSDFIDFLAHANTPSWTVAGIVFTAVVPSIPSYVWRFFFVVSLLKAHEWVACIREEFRPLVVTAIETRSSMGHSFFAVDLVSNLVQRFEDTLEFEVPPILSWQKECALMLSLSIALCGIQETLTCCLLACFIGVNHSFRLGLYKFLTTCVSQMNALNFIAFMLKQHVLTVSFRDKELILKVVLRETELRRKSRSKYSEVRPSDLRVVWSDENYHWRITSPDIYWDLENSNGVKSDGWIVGPWMFAEDDCFGDYEMETFRHRLWLQTYAINLQKADPRVLLKLSLYLQPKSL